MILLRELKDLKMIHIFRCQNCYILLCLLMIQIYFAQGKNLKQLLNKAEGELKTLKKWFDTNKLSINLLYLYNQFEVTLTINHVEIERVYENKFLGVITDHKLCWKQKIISNQNRINLLQYCTN